MPTPYEIIETYCTNSGKNNCTRDLAYSIYCQQYETLALDPSLTPAGINTMLLSNASIIAHVRSADDALAKHVEDELKRIRKELGNRSFGLSIVSGVVGNLVYSLLLVVIFVLAKDQVATWLASVSQVKP